MCIYLSNFTFQYWKEDLNDEYWKITNSIQPLSTKSPKKLNQWISNKYNYTIEIKYIKNQNTSFIKIICNQQLKNTLQISSIMKSISEVTVLDRFTK